MRPRSTGSAGHLLSRGTAVAAALLCALLVVTVPGQEPAPPDAKATAPEAKPDDAEKKEADEPVHIEHADLMTYDPEKNLYFLTGNVHFRHKDTHLYCDKAEYNEDEDTARATGNLKIVQPETTVTGDLITADFGEEVADIDGNVRLVTQKKKEEKAEGEAVTPAPPEAPKEGEQKEGRWEKYKEKVTIVTCNHIRYWYEEKRAVATGNVVAEQEDKKVYGEEAEYVEKEDLLTLKGDPVKAVMDNGNTFTTPWVKAEVEGEQFWTGPIIGIFKREKKDETKPAEGQPAPPAGQPGTPGLPPAPPPP
jgi:lipopolysaccharide assembly outer membrane protein LptD (OstA)